MAKQKRAPSADELAQMAGQLDEFASKFDIDTLPVKLYNKDGSTNYQNVFRLLLSPEMSEYREKNPDVFAAASTNSAIEIGTRLSKLGITAGKLSFAKKQIKEARNISDREPQFPNTPRRSQSLRRAIAQEFGTSDRGLSNVDRRLQNQENALAGEAERRAFIRSNGGQAGSTASNLQVAGERDRARRLGTLSRSESARNQSRNRLSGLIGRDLQQDRFINQHNQNRFNQRTMPLYRQRIAAKDRLLNAGLTNAFNAGDSLFAQSNDLSRLFQGDLPGSAFPNRRYDSDDSPLDGVFNNLANTLKTDIPTNQPERIPGRINRLNPLEAGINNPILDDEFIRNSPLIQ